MILYHEIYHKHLIPLQTFSSSCWLMVMAWKHNKTNIDRYLKQIIATGKRLHKDISKCFESLSSKDQLSEKKKLVCNVMPGALATAEILFSLKMLKIKGQNPLLLVQRYEFFKNGENQLSISNKPAPGFVWFSQKMALNF